MQIRNAVHYGPLPAEIGDLYLPKTSGKHRAAIVLIHGGGWIVGGRSDYAEIGARLAERGVVAFSIDYRLAKVADPQTHWPAQLVDVQLAVRYLRVHAAEFGIDPARIGAMGDSAGGHLAVFLGVLQHIAPGDQAGLYPSQSPAVAAVVDQYGPMALQNTEASLAGSILALFGTQHPSAAALATVSPLPHVSAKSAPTYILHGTKDVIVPFHDSEQLDTALKASRVPTVLVPFNGGHAYDGLPSETILKLQGAAIDWLRRQLHG